MTARELAMSPAIKIATTALLVGLAWADLRAHVDHLEKEKVDRMEFLRVADDVRDIKAILCGRTKDSLCNPKRP